MKKAALITALALPAAAHAGHVVGNGGDVIVCPDRVEMLDLFEGSLFGVRSDPAFASLNAESVLAQVLARLARVDPVRAERLTVQAEDFWIQTSGLRDIALNDVPDSEHILIPAKCRLEQIALQNLPQPNPYRMFVVNLDLWERLNGLNRAALLLHELLYREAVAAGHKDSRRVRQLVFRMVSTDFARQDAAAYHALLRDQIGLRPPTATLHSGMEVWRASREFFPSGWLSSATLAEDYTIPDKPHLTIPRGSTIRFHDGGGIATAPVFASVLVKNSDTEILVWFGAGSHEGSTAELEFSPKGDVAAIRPLDGGSLRLVDSRTKWTWAQFFPVPGEAAVRLHPSGFPVAGYVPAKDSQAYLEGKVQARFLLPDGRTRNTGTGSFMGRFEMDADGKLKCAQVDDLLRYPHREPSSAMNQEFLTRDGSWQKATAGARVCFDTDGFLSSSLPAPDMSDSASSN